MSPQHYIDYPEGDRLTIRICKSGGDHVGTFTFTEGQELILAEKLAERNLDRARRAVAAHYDPQHGADS
ncbi:MAG: hypothetical protein AAFX52_11050 [Pseudomonadota bacterium]